LNPFFSYFIMIVTVQNQNRHHSRTDCLYVVDSCP
jgi:hypothetical protein